MSLAVALFRRLRRAVESRQPDGPPIRSSATSTGVVRTALTRNLTPAFPNHITCFGVALMKTYQRPRAALQLVTPQDRQPRFPLRTLRVPAPVPGPVQTSAAILFAVFVLLIAAAVGRAATISFTTIDDPAADSMHEGTVPLAVSGNNVVGIYYASGISGAGDGFEYNSTTGVWSPLRDPLEGMPSQSVSGGTTPFGISGNNVVGTFDDASNNQHGFLYNGSTWTLLDDPSSNNPSGGTIATGISGNLISGDYYTNGADAHGFLYNTVSKTWQTLNAAGRNNLGTFRVGASAPVTSLATTTTHRMSENLFSITSTISPSRSCKTHSE